MPRQSQPLSWNTIRNYAERFSWEENGVRKQGINPPPHATHIQRVPFFIRYITANGHVEEGMVVCIKVFPTTHQRLVQFTTSGAIRRIRDYLIMEIDGHSFMVH
ncbi:MAG: hypothetical protein IJ557_02420 [Bacteroidaceae bacterium]|nr:hypothetical protein [Bacteroidaceae bacterium]